MEGFASPHLFSGSTLDSYTSGVWHASALLADRVKAVRQPYSGATVAELSAQPATLAPDRTPARRIRRSARSFVVPPPTRHSAPPPPPPPAPRDPSPVTPRPVPSPALAALFGIGRDRLEAHPDAELLVLCAHYLDALDDEQMTGAAQMRGDLDDPRLVAAHEAAGRAATGLLRTLARIQPLTVSGLVAKAGAIRAGLFLNGENPPGPEEAAAFTLLRQIAEGPWA